MPAMNLAPKSGLIGLPPLRAHIGFLPVAFWILSGLLPTDFNGGRGVIHESVALVLWAVDCCVAAAFMLLTVGTAVPGDGT